MNTERNNHERWMFKAIEYAEEALSVGEVPVGCVFVHQDRIIATGRNRTNESSNVCDISLIKST